jgi:hypothetical protein
MTYWLYRLVPASLWNWFADPIVSKALGKPLGKMKESITKER